MSHTNTKKHLIYVSSVQGCYFLSEAENGHHSYVDMEIRTSQNYLFLKLLLDSEWGLPMK